MNAEKYDLKDSLIDFAVRIIHLSVSLPGTTGKNIYQDTARKIIIEYSELNIEFLFPTK